jgi:pyruvate carboxylase
MPTIRRLLAANRSEIATRIFRSAHELKIRTVAIYSHEDRFALHRFKADEAYQIGKSGEPIRSYLDIAAIVKLCVENRIDAVHPGYGFLSENAAFASALRDAGITFIGPSISALELLGDKVAARTIAKKVGVPVLEGSAMAVASLEEASETAKHMGYPIMLKASKGGGGRGMRVVDSADQLASNLEQAQRESKNAFGSDEVFLEKLVGKARHIDTATSSIFMNAIAPSNAVIKKLLRSHRHRIWTNKPLRSFTKLHWPSLVKLATTALAPSSSCSIQNPINSTSSKSIHASKSNIR